MATEVKTGEIVRKVPGQLPAHLADPAPLPDHMKLLVDLQGWISSMMKRTDYNEPSEDHMAQRMMLLTLMSPTPEAILTPDQITGLQDLIPNVPDACTGPIEITDIYVAASDQKDGNRTYVIITWVHLETGEEVTTTTGATQIQVQLIGLLAMGVWPIRVNIRRTDRQDKGGRYMFFMHPADA
jgi:hypothetical protein